MMGISLFPNCLQSGGNVMWQLCDVAIVKRYLISRAVEIGSEHRIARETKRAGEDVAPDGLPDDLPVRSEFASFVMVFSHVSIAFKNASVHSLYGGGVWVDFQNVNSALR